MVIRQSYRLPGQVCGGWSSDTQKRLFFSFRFSSNYSEKRPQWLIFPGFELAFALWKSANGHGIIPIFISICFIIFEECYPFFCPWVKVSCCFFSKCHGLSSFAGFSLSFLPRFFPLFVPVSSMRTYCIYRMSCHHATIHRSANSATFTDREWNKT